jgi:diguanylate cyclase (GGDEF)-like protein
VQLSASTASIALIMAQLCVAIIMSGLSYATPGEKCTRHWAWCGFGVAFGVVVIVLNAGAPRPAVLLLANSSLMLGLVWQWTGLRAYYKKMRGYSGWIVFAVFFVLYCWVLLHNGSLNDRVLVVSPTIATLLLISFCEIWTARATRWSFASVVTLAALSMLALSHIIRTYAIATSAADLRPEANVSIATAYLAPLVGTMLLSFGLMLLYFERIVADKHILATHDDLTGVFNRRAMVAAGAREVETSIRLRRPLAVAYVDIDHFKQINDSFGHEAGDRILVEVAQVLAQTCRSIDMVGRYGGEEFCILLPGVERSGLPGIGERLVNTIRQHNFAEGRSATISVGLAALNGEQNYGTWNMLIDEADRELYKAKAAGRDCYSIAMENSPRFVTAA